jgi:hypothetical protein
MSDKRISSMTDEEVLDYLRRLRQERSALEARMVRAMAHFNSLRHDIADAKYAADEVAAALSWSPRTAASVMTTAVQLVERLPETVDAVEAGQLDMPKARAILEWTEPLPVEQARAVAASVHDWSVGRTAAALRQKLSREVIKVDPDGADARRRVRIKQRSVSYFPDKDGMARLSIYDQADRIRALSELLDHLARTAKAAGDPRTLDALRTDALFELLLGSAGERVRVELRVTVPASVLAGVSNAPGWLHGYGPITSRAIWDLAQQSTFWRRVVTGTVMEVSRRHPSTGLREYVNTRTPTCVGVGCARPAESCEIDHTHDYATGGPTAESNLGPACRHHNLMKLDGRWRLDQPRPGHYIWTTPTGQHYEIAPDPIVDPTPDPIIACDDQPPPF